MGESIINGVSGHSKWATIKRQKGVADLKRGLTFTKLANAITIAVRNGGGIADVEKNFKLRLAVDKARKANMPKENINRAIERALGKGEGDIQEVIYEGFAPHGVSVVIEAATDNSQRTTGEIKSLFDKEGAIFGQPGSVAYQFKQIGIITVNKNAKTFDEIFEMVANTGAEDLQEEGRSFLIYSEPENLGKVRDTLSNNKIEIVNTELIRKPVSTISIEDKEKLIKVTNFLKKLEELDDVQKVYSNLEPFQNN